MRFKTPIPLVYILVLNWKSKEKTVRCVQLLKKMDYDHFKILIIDNGSEDGSEHCLRERFPEEDFIQTGKNLGYAGGNNRGIRHALYNKADYVWIVNPDVEVQSNTLSILVKTMRDNPKIGICGSRVIVREHKDNESIYDYLLEEKEKPYLYRGYKVDEKIQNHTGLINTTFVLGCSMLIRSEMIREIGLLREEFFLYCEEVEYNLRAQKRSWKTMNNITTWVSHSADDVPSKEFTGQRAYYYRRARLILARTQRCHILQVAVEMCKLKNVMKYLLQLKFRNAAYILKQTMPIVLDGFKMRLGPIQKI